MKLKTSFRRIVPMLLMIFMLALMSFSAQERFRRYPPAPEPLTELSLPRIQTQMLANGLSLSLVKLENLPVVQLSLIVHTGEAFSPDELPGLATFVSNIFSTGTQILSEGEIKEIIETTGGDFSIQTRLEHSIFKFSFLKEHLDEALEILSQMIVTPGFIPREIDNLKRRLYYELLQQKRGPEFLAKRVLYRNLFENHSAEKIIYSEEGIKDFTREAILDFYDKYYCPNNAQLLLIGDLDMMTATRKATRYFSRWGQKECIPIHFDPPIPSQELKVCFIDMPQTSEATIVMGNIVTPFQAENLHSFAVFNRVLGETANSRIFMNLRESKGYAYFAFSQFEIFKNFAVFYIRAKVRPDATCESIKEILKEIEILLNRAIPPLQIEQAKSSLIGNFPLKIMDIQGISSRIMQILIYDLGNIYWNQYYENIMQVNSRSVYDLVRTYSLLTPVIIVAGDKNLIFDSLVEELGEVHLCDHKGNVIETIKE